MRKLLLFFFALLTGVSGAWATPVSVPGGILSTKCYTITTKTRGSLIVKSGTTRLAGNNESGFETDFNASDAQFQFAFIPYAGKTYLYSVGEGKFISYTDKGYLVSVPNTTDAITIEATTNSLSGYPLGIRFYNNTNSAAGCVNLGGSGQITIDTWGATWGTFGEDGNAWAIEEADDFDSSDAISAIMNNPEIINNWNITSSDLTTNFWTAMGGSTPAGVTALGSYTPYYRTQEITLSASQTGALEVFFKYTSGSHRLEILGVDLLDGSDNVVAYDYHWGYTGTGTENNTYLLTGLTAGSYKLRYIINGASISSSVGNITVMNFADSYANITQWYSLRIHSSYQNNYIYYDSGAATKINFTGISTSDLSDVNNNYLWGFVYSSGGIQIYNKVAGSSVALDLATPSTLSAEGTSASLKFHTGNYGSYGTAADACFTIYDTGNSNYINYNSGGLNRWSGADQGSTFMIDAIDESTTLSYTLTDVNGATYSGTYSGLAGITTPSITGCDGYSLSNLSWSGTSLSSDITFPFPISSNNVTNWTYIGSFASLSRTSQYAWHVTGSDATDIITQSNVLPTNETGDIDKWEWAIEVSSHSAGAFTFSIKNRSTSKYITCSSSQHDHEQGSVTLTSTGTNLVCSGNAWKVSDATYYLSINSYQPDPADKIQYLGQHSSTHYGTNVGYVTPTDFTTLMSDLTSTAIAASRITEGTGYGEYVVTSAFTDACTTAASVIAGTTYATAAEFTSLKNTMINEASLNMPVAPCFLRIKTRHNTYLSNTAATYSGYTSYLAHIAETDNSTLFYYDGTNLIDYAAGLKVNGCNVGSVGGAGKSFTFAESTYNILQGKYSVKYNDGSDKFIYTWGSPYNFTEGQASEAPNTVMTLVDVTSLPVTISSAKYATLYTPVSLTVPANVTAFWGEDNGTAIILHSINSGETIPADNGVILYSETADTYDFDITTGGSISGTNAIKGDVVTKARSGQYTLQMPSDSGDTPAFYADGPTNLQGFKAYLDTDSSPVKSIVLYDETAVKAIEAAMSPGKTIYDMNGRCVENPIKGLYIVNGKKVIIK